MASKLATANHNPARYGVFGVDEKGNDTILFTRMLNHPIEKVWLAITDETHRAVWFPQLGLEHGEGGKAVVNFSGGDCPPPEDNPSDVYYCKITAWEPPTLLEYIGDGEHHRYELEKAGSGCLLRFQATVPGRGTYDDESKTVISRFSVACGWHMMVDQLEWQLDGVPFEDEGYAGPIKTEYYLQYMKMDRDS